ncbi:hypothetical protein PVAP13_3KG264154 [Panicum virgatum]|uniref:Uncharacterized protein n=1 Tax=Panicum virgatum TaxID=38727 RepID=A0A8T0V2H8_PANVG|nr:hypothetical protein PVAP13_3KG264154 [Panicum virgatum]
MNSHSGSSLPLPLRGGSRVATPIPLPRFAETPISPHHLARPAIPGRPSNDPPPVPAVRREQAAPRPVPLHASQPTAGTPTPTAAQAPGPLSAKPWRKTMYTLLLLRHAATNIAMEASRGSALQPMATCATPPLSCSCSSTLRPANPSVAPAPVLPLYAAPRRLLRATEKTTMAGGSARPRHGSAELAHELIEPARAVKRAGPSLALSSL